MRWNRICLGQRFITVLLLAIGLNAYGCKDSVSVSEDVQVPLASLTVTPGTLQPGFFSNTTNYTVNAPTSATSVTVTAIPKDNTATVTINKAVTTHLSVTLGGPGSTTIITIVLEAQNGAESTYTVNVTRVLSSDNNLSALDVTPGNLAPAFSPDTENYIVNVGVLVDSVTVSATKSDPTAMMLIGPTPVPPGTASGQTTIQLGGPGTATPVTITVTAPNGTAKTYTITVNRAALSGNNNLSALTVTPGTLVPSFNPGALDYTVDVGIDVTEVTVTATKSDSNAVISGDVPNEGQAIIQLDGPGSSRLVSIIVTAPNGNSKTYTITVNRAAPSSDNNLSALTVTGGPLVPDFTPSTTTYTVDVPSSVDTVTVSAIKADPNAVMSGDVTAGTGIATGQATFSLVPLFPRSVSITVTAPNGDSKIYSITITRALF
ncbi:MAG TPA: cadherin-like beta sandwich domain-containing protein [Nitrospira sp.]|nr:cadherin-like beta sandwich domain-containing protein [Nitrospira sp.]